MAKAETTSAKEREIEEHIKFHEEMAAYNRKKAEEEAKKYENKKIGY